MRESLIASGKTVSTLMGYIAYGQYCIGFIGMFPILQCISLDLQHLSRYLAFVELEDVAQHLYRAYATSRGYEWAMHPQSDHDRKSAASGAADSLLRQSQASSWEHTVPIGRPWDPTASQAGSMSAIHSATAPQLDNSANETFKGDRVLAQSIVLMRDILKLREFVYATCEGDVGRVYEVLKVRLFLLDSDLHIERPIEYGLHICRLYTLQVYRISSRDDYQP